MSASRKRGLTLVEVLVGAAIGAILLTVLMTMLGQASQLFVRGEGALGGRQAARIFMDALGHDLAQVIQTPGDPRPPVVIGEDGALYFYVARIPTTVEEPVGGAPVRWGREPLDAQESEVEDGPGHPQRNDHVIRGLLLDGWEFELLPLGEDVTGWELEVRVRVSRGALLSPETMSRRYALGQPTSNLLYFPSHGRILPGVVQLPAEPDPGSPFRWLGAPDSIVYLDETGEETAPLLDVEDLPEAPAPPYSRDERRQGSLPPGAP